MRIDHLGAADNRPCSKPRAPSEFADLVDGYADRLVRFAFRRLGSIQDAEDIVHDVFVKMFTAERHDPIVLCGPYLFRSVANACIDLLRRRARLPSLHDDLAFDRLSSAGPGPSGRSGCATRWRLPASRGSPASIRTASASCWAESASS